MQRSLVLVTEQSKMRNSSPNQQPEEGKQQATPKTVPLYNSAAASEAPYASDSVQPSAGAPVHGPIPVTSSAPTQPMPAVVPGAQEPQPASTMPFEPAQVQPAYSQSVTQSVPYVAAPTNIPVPEGLNVLQLEEDPSIPVMTPSRKKGKGNALLTVGIIACLVAIVVLVLTLLAIQFKPFGLFADNFTAPDPTRSQIEAAFDKARTPDPDLSNIKYVKTKDLKRDTIGEYESSDVQYVESGSTREAVCEAKATAVWSNDALTVVQPLFMSMKYNRQSNAWESGSVREGNLTVRPIKAPDKADLLAAFPDILKEYDPALAEMYKDATISDESTLSNDGGSMIFTLNKNKEDGTPITCKVNSTVSWNDASGWVVRITSVEGDVASTVTQEPAPDPAPAPETAGGDAGNTPSGGTENTGGGTVIYQLVCFSGELVEVPGIITFDSNGHILLKTDNTLQVVLDNRLYQSNYFEIVGNGSWSNGQRVTVIGEISAGGSLQQAPLVINTSY